MPRVTKTLTPVRGRRYRFTREDACGNPVYGDNGQVVTKGVITATFTSTTSETDEIRVVNSGGETCIYEPAITNLEGFSVDINVCGMDPDMFNMLTGAPVYTDVDGVIVGNFFDIDVNLEDFAAGLEIWTGLASGDACGEVGEVEYGYVALPFLKGGRLADFTIENGAINFTITGMTTRRGGSWGKGPYNVVVNAGDVAGPLLEAFTSTAVMLAIRTKVAPPQFYEGGRPLLDPAWTTLTDVDGVATDLEVDFEVTPSVVSGEGVWYDFGDDTWDYVTTNGGDTTHEYLEPGTYTVTASANGTVVTTTVVVTEGS